MDNNVFDDFDLTPDALRRLSSPDQRRVLDAVAASAVAEEVAIRHELEGNAPAADAAWAEAAEAWGLAEELCAELLEHGFGVVDDDGCEAEQAYYTPDLTMMLLDKIEQWRAEPLYVQHNYAWTPLEQLLFHGEETRVLVDRSGRRYVRTPLEVDDVRCPQDSTYRANDVRGRVTGPLLDVWTAEDDPAEVVGPTTLVQRGARYRPDAEILDEKLMTALWWVAATAGTTLTLNATAQTAREMLEDLEAAHAVRVRANQARYLQAA